MNPVTTFRRLTLLTTLAFTTLAAHAQRQRISLDAGWRFALGNAIDSTKDFGFDNGELFFYSKAGKGNGPADPHFDDRAWQPINLPHDWAVALPFDSRGDENHGSKAIGHNFPQNSIGWYRRSFNLAPSDEGKRIRIDFDGVYRDAQVWLNGFYIGTEPSGYESFGYDVTDYLNYDAPNTLVVRVDASQQEGWFYEGAGIYRHVWLTRTAPVHVAHDGTFVVSTVDDPLAAHPSAQLSVAVTVRNDALTAETYTVEISVEDPTGATVASTQPVSATTAAGGLADETFSLKVADARLWSIETPNLYTLITTVRAGGKIVDQYKTPFGIRKVEWTADRGFFLNGKHVEIKGTNDHQDAAGVGIALPDDLQEFRIARLKALGSNAIRTSHNAPAPAMLDAADRLGMLILDENRMMGTTPEAEAQLTAQIERDRNHPSVVIWSLGNEEWALEWSVYGTRLARDLTALAQRLDPSRRSTVAMSGTSAGISLAVDVMGYNYFLQHHIDQMHARFPDRPSVGTEESSSEHTRGMYFDDLPHQHLVGFDFEADGKHASIEEGWRYYQARPFTSGLFYWTGFDYRGETTPFGYPAISSQFGLLDTCGFMKDTAFAARSFWTDAKTQPMVHLATTWTLPNKVQHGGLGESIPVLVYSNASSVELSLNGKLLGKKQMPENSHLEWQVPYEPGTLLATAYNAAGIEIAHDKVETVSAPAEIHLDPSKSTLAADGTSLSLIAVRVDDARHRMVPDASNLISFTLTGPGRILGVGNGDPASHEPDQFLPAYASIPVVNWHTRAVDSLKPGPETAPAFDDSGWAKAEDPRWDEKPNPPAVSVFRGSFTVPDVEANATLTLLFAPVGDSQSFYLNGQPLVETMPHTLANYPYTVPAGLLHPGKNIITIYATRFTEKNGSDKHWTWSHGGPVTVAAALPAPQWQRSVFNGLAQIIVQSTGQPGEITLTATSPNLTPAKLTIPTH